MDNHILTILRNFEKPDSSFLKEKECLICLELFDLESNKFVQLPCKCSNSVYHIDCILQLLHSGQNKNFCPHCKTNYEIQLQIQVTRYQILPYNVINTQLEPDINYEQVKKFTHLLVIHIVTNSILNIINIVTSKNYADNKDNPEVLQVLMLFYFCKLFFNYVILMYAKNNIEKIEVCLVYSYTFQTMLIGVLIYTLTKIKIDNISIILLVNNIFLGFGDVTYRIILENRMRNTVNVLR
jgi:hypothetical protein